MRAASAVAALMLLLAVPASASGSIEIVETNIEDHPQVVVVVDVPAGFHGTELPAEAFTIVEDGFPVSAGVWTSRQEPLGVVLVLDTSGSMQGDPLAAARGAAVAFIEALPSGARVGVVTFGDNAAVRHPMSADRAAAADAVASLEADGETALYDAVVMAAGLLQPEEERSVLIVLSDGGDTVSSASLDSAVPVLLESGAEVHAIGLQTDETDAAALGSLAAAGGGSMVGIEEADRLGDAFGGIADGLAGRYRLAYLTRRHGPVDLIVGVSHDGMTASASITIELPGSPGPAPTATVPGPETAGTIEPIVPVPTFAADPSLLSSPWTMPAGIVLTVGGMTVLLVLLAVGGRGRTAVRSPAPVGRRRGLLRLLRRRAEGVTDRVIQGREPGRLERDLDRAGVALRPTEFVLLSASLGVTAVAGTILVLSPAVALVTAVISVGLPRVVLRALTARRRAAFADQFDGTLQMLSGSLRAGYGLMQAVGTISEEASNPTAKEFGRVSVENRLGRSVDESLHALAERMDNEDLRWVVEAIDIQYEVGGDLAEVLDTVAGTIRDRDQIRRQIRALSAEGRISAVVLVSMPFALAVLISMVSPDYLAELTGTTFGRVMIGGALLMIGAGAAWIRRIVKVVF